MSLQTNDAAAVQKFVDEAQEIPVPEPTDGVWTIPGGWLDNSGVVHKQVMLRELSGADEEALSRATRKGVFDPLLFVRTAVKRGLESIDGLPVTDEMIDRLYIGDLDFIALAIRMITYGDEYEVSYTCPQCNHQGDLVVELNKDINIRTLSDPEIWSRTVDLPKGRKASVHMVTVADRTVAFSDESRTAAEIDTVIMSRVVREIDGAPVIGVQTMLEASAGDRKAIRDYLIKNQPGPDFGEVKGTCPACDGELPLPLSLPALFL